MEHKLLQRWMQAHYLRGRLLVLTANLLLASTSLGQPLDPIIAFSSSRENPDGNHDIFIMMADGSQQHNLTKNPKS